MARKTIQTQLLGRAVVPSPLVLDAQRNNVSLGFKWDGEKSGVIRSVWIDKEGTIQYTIETPDGRLIDMYDSGFTMVPEGVTVDAPAA